jgi:hypothetical protein
MDDENDIIRRRERFMTKHEKEFNRAADTRINLTLVEHGVGRVLTRAINPTLFPHYKIKGREANPSKNPFAENRIGKQKTRTSYRRGH